MGNSIESLINILLSVIGIPGIILTAILLFALIRHVAKRIFNKKEIENQLLTESTKLAKDYFQGTAKSIVNNFKILAYIMLGLSFISAFLGLIFGDNGFTSKQKILLISLFIFSTVVTFAIYLFSKRVGSKKSIDKEQTSE